jgi:hypothetical protein
MLVGSEVKSLMERDSQHVHLQMKFELALAALKGLRGHSSECADIIEYAGCICHVRFVEKSLKEIENVGKPEHSNL